MGKGKNADLSKKQKDAGKTKMVVDKTFGMKNKNKSKKVQKYIQNVQSAADNRFTNRKEEKEKQKAMSKKEAKKQHEAEIAALFNVVEDKPKKKKIAAAAPEAAPAEESIDDTAAFLAQMGIEVPQADGRRKQARDRRTAAANAKEEERLRKIAEKDGKSIEERLEIVRKGLQLDVPVNKDSFLEWKKERDARKQQQEEAALAKAKKGTSKNGKGKSQLTGRQLFEFNETLFVDDAEASAGKEQYAVEFEDAEDANRVIEGGEAEGLMDEGASGEAAAAEDADVPPVASNSTAVAPEAEPAAVNVDESLEGVDESVFLAEDLGDLDDLPSDDDDE